MEEKIYDRQLNKESLAARLFDEHQIERHFTSAELDQLYDVEALNPVRENNTVSCPVEDELLATVIQEHESHIWSLNKHDDLLQNKLEEQLSKEDQDKAWACFNEMKQLQKALPKRIQMKAFWSIFQGPPSPEGVSGPPETTKLDSFVTCNKKINQALGSVQCPDSKNGKKPLQVEEAKERYNNDCWQRDRKWRGTIQWKTEGTLKVIQGCEVSYVRDTSQENEDEIEGCLPEVLELSFTERGVFRRPAKHTKFKTFAFHFNKNDKLEELLRASIATASFVNKQKLEETLALTLFKCGQKKLLLGNHLILLEVFFATQS